MVPVGNGSGPVPAGHFTRTGQRTNVHRPRSIGWWRRRNCHPEGPLPAPDRPTDGWRYSKGRRVQPGNGSKIEVEGRGDETEVRIGGRICSTSARIDIGEGVMISMARQNETLLDVLIRSFSERLLVQVRTGLPREYVECEADLPHLRGRLICAAAIHCECSQARPPRMSI